MYTMPYYTYAHMCASLRYRIDIILMCNIYIPVFYVQTTSQPCQHQKLQMHHYGRRHEVNDNVERPAIIPRTHRALAHIENRRHVRVVYIKLEDIILGRRSRAFNIFHFLYI